MSIYGKIIGFSTLCLCGIITYATISTFVDDKNSIDDINLSELPAVESVYYIDSENTNNSTVDLEELELDTESTELQVNDESGSDLLYEEDLSDLIAEEEEAEHRAALTEDGFYLLYGEVLSREEYLTMKAEYDLEAQLDEKNKTAEDLEYEDLFTDIDSIYIYSEGNPNSESFKYLRDELRTIDIRLIKSFINHHGQFYISDENTFNGIRATDDTAAFARGYHNMDGCYNYTAIHCYDGDAHYFDYVLTHELGHALANSTFDSTGERVIYSDVWKDIYNTEVNNSGFRSHLTENRCEFFAGCIESYYANDGLETRCPKAYAYIDEIISSLEY